MKRETFKMTAYRMPQRMPNRYRPIIASARYRLGKKALIIMV